MNAQTLRYYEPRGLLPEPERSRSGYRGYGMAGTRIIDLACRIAELTTMRQALDQLVLTCEQPRGQRECPILHEIADDDALLRRTP